MTAMVAASRSKGTTNEPWAKPAPELPLFKLTCHASVKPHPFLGRVIYTQDPGYALTPGRCEDIGKITMQSMRGLAARAPYFANGSAKTLREIVEIYNRRYQIRLSALEAANPTMDARRLRPGRPGRNEPVSGRVSVTRGRHARADRGSEPNRDARPDRDVD